MNQKDFDEFNKLVKTNVRSEEREKALNAWELYRQSRQEALFVQRRNKSMQSGNKDFPDGAGYWNKGDSIQAQSLPAINLRGATFTDVCIGYADLRGAVLDDVVFAHKNLPWTALKGARLENASLRKVMLSEGRLLNSNLSNTDFTKANLRNADLSYSDLKGAILYEADLTGANLESSNLTGANLEGCKLDRARVYGVAAWDVKGTPVSSKDLIITPNDNASITTDDIRVAQFIYLLVNNPEIRNVLDAVTKKVVLILGRFTPERKKILDALRDSLRSRNFVPVLFDFEQAADRDITETITLLARMARFVIADLTDPASIPQELQAIAPHVAVPIRLIIENGKTPYSMAKDLKKYQWVIRPYRYNNLDDLLKNLEENIINISEKTRIKIEKIRSDDDW